MDVLTTKAIRAARDAGVEQLLLGGGVAANSRLRELAAQRCETPASGCGCPRRSCVPTTGPWWPRSALQLVAAGARRRSWTSPPTLAADHRGAAVIVFRVLITFSPGFDALAVPQRTIAGKT